MICKFKFCLGQGVKDIVNSFEGVIMGRTEYFTGCRQYGVASRKLTNEGEVKNWQWIDEDRLIAQGKSIKKEINNNGGSSEQQPIKY